MLRLLDCEQAEIHTPSTENLIPRIDVDDTIQRRSVISASLQPVCFQLKSFVVTFLESVQSICASTATKVPNTQTMSRMVHCRSH